jgi:aminopeptidase
MDDRLITRYADLIVRAGANVQPGQPVRVTTELGNEQLLRAVNERCYEVGATFVDAQYLDPHVRRSRIVHAPLETLGTYPRWVAEGALGLGRERAAHIWLSGSNERHLLDDVDPARIGRWRPPGARESVQTTNDRTVNWTVAGAPSVGWARDVYPELDGEEALARLWEDVAYMARLDAEDPVAAWRERTGELRQAAARLNEERLDAVRFSGPGTELTVGLLPGSIWKGGGETTVDGIEHIVNLPTEEVFTTPDPERTEGVVRATMPLELFGARIDGIEIRFEGGRAVSIDAERGADVLRGRTQADEGAARLGEVALVDGATRVGRRGRVFLDTLYDENAASHIALGGAYASAVADEDRERMNDSVIHVDFMIGGDDVAVTGVARDGREFPLLQDGRWQI